MKSRERKEGKYLDSLIEETDKDLISKVHKQLMQLSVKQATAQPKAGQRIEHEPENQLYKRQKV